MVASNHLGWERVRITHRSMRSLGSYTFGNNTFDSTALLIINLQCEALLVIVITRMILLLQLVDRLHIVSSTVSRLQL